MAGPAPTRALRTAKSAPAPVDRSAALGARVEQRRAQLAASALRTLGELGYTKTSLRDIAANSDFSHGVLHYYFRDKTDLILCSVGLYKAQSVIRYDTIVAASHTAAELCDRFGTAISRTAVDDAALHRLWYDLRAQSAFDPALVADVVALDRSLEQVIWRVVSRYCQLAGASCRWTAEEAYPLIDGLFQQALMHDLTGRPGVADELRGRVSRLLELAALPA